jgi:hypothetical protein
MPQPSLTRRRWCQFALGTAAYAATYACFVHAVVTGVDIAYLTNREATLERTPFVLHQQAISAKLFIGCVTAWLGVAGARCFSWLYNKKRGDIKAATSRVWYQFSIASLLVVVTVAALMVVVTPSAWHHYEDWRSKQRMRELIAQIMSAPKQPRAHLMDEIDLRPSNMDASHPN